MRRSGITAVTVLALLVAMFGVHTSAANAAGPPVTFAPKLDLALASTQKATVSAVGDLNGDTFPDLVAASDGATTGAVSVFLGDGQGGFGARSDYAIANREPMSVALGDLNGDGFLDVVVPSLDAHAVSVLLGDGHGGLGAHTDFPTGGDPWSVALGDVNGDGFVDVVVSNSDVNTVSVLLGDGRGGLGTRTDLSISTVQVLLHDMNGDGVLDLLVADRGSNTVQVRLGDGNGNFGAPAGVGNFPAPWVFGLADLNGDGHLDLVVANSNLQSVSGGSVSVELGDGQGGFGTRADYTVGTSHWPLSMVLSDLNGDHVTDVAVADQTDFGVTHSDVVSVLLGDGAGRFEGLTSVSTGGFDTPYGVTAADFNSDGLPDLAVSDGSVSVLFNTTAPAPPGPPTMLRNATAGHTFATVSWTAPASDGGSPITGYTLTPYVGYWPLQPVTFNSRATTQIVGELTDGVTYRFKVAAINAIGTGPTSAVSNPVTPNPTAPTAPTIGTAAAGDSQATVTWIAPASDGGSPVLGYVVTAYVGFSPVKVRIFNTTLTTQTVTGLANGTQYRFRVSAYNAIGVSPFSKVSNLVEPTA